MTHFLEGVLVGFLGGGFMAYFAFNAVTKRMAKAIFSEEETCHR
jgi:hypothetical protein